MLHNSLRRKQNRLDLLGLIIVGLLAGAFVIGVCFGLFEGAYEFVSSDRTTWLSLFFWAVFLWWQIFPIVAAGFGGAFRFRPRFRFPVSFGAFYMIWADYGVGRFSGFATVWSRAAV